MDDLITLEPGQATLSDWRAIYEGASFELNTNAKDSVDASASTVQKILASGKPISACVR